MGVLDERDKIRSIIDGNVNEAERAYLRFVGSKDTQNYAYDYANAQRDKDITRMIKAANDIKAQNAQNDFNDAKLWLDNNFTGLYATEAQFNADNNLSSKYNSYNDYILSTAYGINDKYGNVFNTQSQLLKDMASYKDNGTVAYSNRPIVNEYNATRDDWINQARAYVGRTTVGEERFNNDVELRRRYTSYEDYLNAQIAEKNANTGNTFKPTGNAARFNSNEISGYLFNQGSQYRDTEKSNQQEWRRQAGAFIGYGNYLDEDGFYKSDDFVNRYGSYDNYLADMIKRKENTSSTKFVLTGNLANTNYDYQANLYNEIQQRANPDEEYEQLMYNYVQAVIGRNQRANAGVDTSDYDANIAEMTQRMTELYPQTTAYYEQQVADSKQNVRNLQRNYDWAPSDDLQTSIDEAKASVSDAKQALQTHKDESRDYSEILTDQYKAARSEYLQALRDFDAKYPTHENINPSDLNQILEMEQNVQNMKDQLGLYSVATASDFGDYMGRSAIGGLWVGAEDVVNAGIGYVNAVSRAQAMSSNAMTDYYVRRALGEQNVDVPDIIQHEDYEDIPFLEKGRQYAQETNYRYGNTKGIMKQAGDAIEQIAHMVPSMTAGAVVGYLAAPLGATAAVASAFASKAVLGLSAAGSAIYEAKQNGVNDAVAITYGTAVGMVEILTEMMFDGVAGVYGAGAFDDIVDSFVGSVSSNTFVQNTIKNAIDTIGEGVEEYVSEYADYFIASILDQTGKLDNRQFNQVHKDALQSFVSGAVVSGVMQLGSIPVNQLREGIGNTAVAAKAKEAVIQKMLDRATKSFYNSMSIYKRVLQQNPDLANSDYAGQMALDFINLEISYATATGIDVEDFLAHPEKYDFAINKIYDTLYKKYSDILQKEYAKRSPNKEKIEALESFLQEIPNQENVQFNRPEARDPSGLQNVIDALTGNIGKARNGIGTAVNTLGSNIERGAGNLGTNILNWYTNFRNRKAAEMTPTEVAPTEAAPVAPAEATTAEAIVAPTQSEAQAPVQQAPVPVQAEAPAQSQANATVSFDPLPEIDGSYDSEGLQELKNNLLVEYNQLAQRARQAAANNANGDLYAINQRMQDIVKKINEIDAFNAVEQQIFENDKEDLTEQINNITSQVESVEAPAVQQEQKAEPPKQQSNTLDYDPKLIEKMSNEELASLMKTLDDKIAKLISDRASVNRRSVVSTNKRGQIEFINNEIAKLNAAKSDVQLEMDYRAYYVDPLQKSEYKYIATVARNNEETGGDYLVSIPNANVAEGTKVTLQPMIETNGNVSKYTMYAVTEDGTKIPLNSFNHIYFKAVAHGVQYEAVVKNVVREGASSATPCIAISMISPDATTFMNTNNPVAVENIEVSSTQIASNKIIRDAPAAPVQNNAEVQGSTNTSTTQTPSVAAQEAAQATQVPQTSNVSSEQQNAVQSPVEAQNVVAAAESENTGTNESRTDYEVSPGTAVEAPSITQQDVDRINGAKLKAVGVTHEGRQDAVSKLTSGQEIRLVQREAGGDPNAIEIVDGDGNSLGFIAKSSTLRDTINAALSSPDVEVTGRVVSVGQSKNGKYGFSFEINATQNTNQEVNNGIQSNQGTGDGSLPQQYAGSDSGGTGSYRTGTGSTISEHTQAGSFGDETEHSRSLNDANLQPVQRNPVQRLTDYNGEKLNITPDAQVNDGDTFRFSRMGDGTVSIVNNETDEIVKTFDSPVLLNQLNDIEENGRGTVEITAVNNNGTIELHATFYPHIGAEVAESAGVKQYVPSSSMERHLEQTMPWHVRAKTSECNGVARAFAARGVNVYAVDSQTFQGAERTEAVGGEVAMLITPNSNGTVVEHEAMHYTMLTDERAAKAVCDAVNAIFSGLNKQINITYTNANGTCNINSVGKFLMHISKTVNGNVDFYSLNFEQKARVVNELVATLSSSNVDLNMFSPQVSALIEQIRGFMNDSNFAENTKKCKENGMTAQKRIASTYSEETRVNPNQAEIDKLKARAAELEAIKASGTTLSLSMRRELQDINRKIKYHESYGFGSVDMKNIFALVDAMRHGQQFAIDRAAKVGYALNSNGNLVMTDKQFQLDMTDSTRLSSVPEELVGFARSVIDAGMELSWKDVLATMNRKGMSLHEVGRLLNVLPVPGAFGSFTVNGNTYNLSEISLNPSDKNTNPINGDTSADYSTQAEYAMMNELYSFFGKGENMPRSIYADRIEQLNTEAYESAIAYAISNLIDTIDGNRTGGRSESIRVYDPGNKYNGKREGNSPYKLIIPGKEGGNPNISLMDVIIAQVDALTYRSDSRPEAGEVRYTKNGVEIKENVKQFSFADMVLDDGSDTYMTADTDSEADQQQWDQEILAAQKDAQNAYETNLLAFSSTGENIPDETETAPVRARGSDRSFNHGNQESAMERVEPFVEEGLVTWDDVHKAGPDAILAYMQPDARDAMRLRALYARNLVTKETIEKTPAKIILNKFKNYDLTQYPVVNKVSDQPITDEMLAGITMYQSEDTLDYGDKESIPYSPSSANGNHSSMWDSIDKSIEMQTEGRPILTAKGFFFAFNDPALVKEGSLSPMFFNNFRQVAEIARSKNNMEALEKLQLLEELKGELIHAADSGSIAISKDGSISIPATFEIGEGTMRDVRTGELSGVLGDLETCLATLLNYRESDTTRITKAIDFNNNFVKEELIPSYVYNAMRGLQNVLSARNSVQITFAEDSIEGISDPNEMRIELEDVYGIKDISVQEEIVNLFANRKSLMQQRDALNERRQSAKDIKNVKARDSEFARILNEYNRLSNEIANTEQKISEHIGLYAAPRLTADELAAAAGDKTFQVRDRDGNITTVSIAAYLQDMTAHINKRTGEINDQRETVDKAERLVASLEEAINNAVPETPENASIAERYELAKAAYDSIEQSRPISDPKAGQTYNENEYQQYLSDLRVAKDELDAAKRALDNSIEERTNAAPSDLREKLIDAKYNLEVARNTLHRLEKGFHGMNGIFSLVLQGKYTVDNYDAIQMQAENGDYNPEDFNTEKYRTIIGANGVPTIYAYKNTDPTSRSDVRRKGGNNTLQSDSTLYPHNLYAIHPAVMLQFEQEFWSNPYVMGIMKEKAENVSDFPNKILREERLGIQTIGNLNGSKDLYAIARNAAESSVKRQTETEIASRVQNMTQQEKDALKAEQGIDIDELWNDHIWYKNYYAICAYAWMQRHLYDVDADGNYLYEDEIDAVRENKDNDNYIVDILTDLFTKHPEANPNPLTTDQLRQLRQGVRDYGDFLNNFVSEDGPWKSGPYDTREAQLSDIIPNKDNFIKNQPDAAGLMGYKVVIGIPRNSVFTENFSFDPKNKVITLDKSQSPSEQAEALRTAITLATFFYEDGEYKVPFDVVNALTEEQKKLRGLDRDSISEMRSILEGTDKDGKPFLNKQEMAMYEKYGKDPVRFIQSMLRQPNNAAKSWYKDHNNPVPGKNGREVRLMDIYTRFSNGSESGAVTVESERMNAARFLARQLAAKGYQAPSTVEGRVDNIVGFLRNYLLGERGAKTIDPRGIKFNGAADVLDYVQSLTEGNYFDKDTFIQLINGNAVDGLTQSFISHEDDYRAEVETWKKNGKHEDEAPEKTEYQQARTKWRLAQQKYINSETGKEIDNVDTVTLISEVISEYGSIDDADAKGLVEMFMQSEAFGNHIAASVRAEYERLASEGKYDEAASKATAYLNAMAEKYGTEVNPGIRRTSHISGNWAQQIVTSFYNTFSYDPKIKTEFEKAFATGKYDDLAEDLKNGVLKNVTDESIANELKLILGYSAMMSTEDVVKELLAKNPSATVSNSLSPNDALRALVTDKQYNDAVENAKYNAYVQMYFEDGRRSKYERVGGQIRRAIDNIEKISGQKFDYNALRQRIADIDSERGPINSSTAADVELKEEIPRDSYDRMKKRLDGFIAMRPKLAEDLNIARGFGDLSENSEYHDAKEAINKNESRISEFEKLLRGYIPSDNVKDTGKAKFGSVVTLTNGTATTSIVIEFPDAFEKANGDVHDVASKDSYIGRKLVGTTVGDTVNLGPFGTFTVDKVDVWDGSGVTEKKYTKHDKKAEQVGEARSFGVPAGANAEVNVPDGLGRVGDRQMSLFGARLMSSMQNNIMSRMVDMDYDDATVRMIENQDEIMEGDIFRYVFSRDRNALSDEIETAKSEVADTMQFIDATFNNVFNTLQNAVKNNAKSANVLRAFQEVTETVFGTQGNSAFHMMEQIGEGKFADTRAVLEKLGYYDVLKNAYDTVKSDHIKLSLMATMSDIFQTPTKGSYSNNGQSYNIEDVVTETQWNSAIARGAKAKLREAFGSDFDSRMESLKTDPEAFNALDRENQYLFTLYQAARNKINAGSAIQMASNADKYQGAVATVAEIARMNQDSRLAELACMGPEAIMKCLYAASYSSNLSDRARDAIQDFSLDMTVRESTALLDNVDQFSKTNPDMKECEQFAERFFGKSGSSSFTNPDFLLANYGEFARRSYLEQERDAEIERENMKNKKSEDVESYGIAFVANGKGQAGVNIDTTEDSLLNAFYGFAFNSMRMPEGIDADKQKEINKKIKSDVIKAALEKLDSSMSSVAHDSYADRFDLFDSGDPSEALFANDHDVSEAVSAAIINRINELYEKVKGLSSMQKRLGKYATHEQLAEAICLYNLALDFAYANSNDANYVARPVNGEYDKGYLNAVMKCFDFISANSVDSIVSNAVASTVARWNPDFQVNYLRQKLTGWALNNKITARTDPNTKAIIHDEELGVTEKDYRELRDALANGDQKAANKKYEEISKIASKAFTKLNPDRKAILKATLSHELKTWMYGSMLSRATTWAHNVTSTAASYVANKIGNRVAEAVEDSKVKQGKMQQEDAVHGSTTKAENPELYSIADSQWVLAEEQVLKKNRIIGAASKAAEKVSMTHISDAVFYPNQYGLETPDKLFGKTTFNQEFAGVLESRGIKTKADWDALTRDQQDDIRAIAIDRAQIVLYRNVTRFSEMLEQIKQVKVNVGNKEVPIGKLVSLRIPFNIGATLTTTAVETTPIGLISYAANEVIHQIQEKHSPGTHERSTASKARQNRRAVLGTSGTMLMLAGAFMAAMGGGATGGDDDDKKFYLTSADAEDPTMAGIQNEHGFQKYSLHIPDFLGTNGGKGRYYSIEQLWPIGLPLMWGALSYELFSGARSLGSTVEEAGKAFLNNSVYSSVTSIVNDFFDAWDRANKEDKGLDKAKTFVTTLAGNAANTLLSRFVPGGLSIVEDLFFENGLSPKIEQDKAGRKWDSGSDVPYHVQVLLANISEGVWGMNLYQGHSVSGTGETAKRPHPAQWLVDLLLGNSTEDKTFVYSGWKDEMSQMTDEDGKSYASVFPEQSIEYSTYVDKTRLSNAEYEIYSKAYGDFNRAYMESLTYNDAFMALPVEQKALVLESLKSYSNAMASNAVRSERGSSMKYSNEAKALAGKSVDTVIEYYLMKHTWNALNNAATDFEVTESAVADFENAFEKNPDGFAARTLIDLVQDDDLLVACIEASDKGYDVGEYIEAYHAVKLAVEKGHAGEITTQQGRRLDNVIESLGDDELEYLVETSSKSDLKLLIAAHEAGINTKEYYNNVYPARKQYDKDHDINKFADTISAHYPVGSDKYNAITDNTWLNINMNALDNKNKSVDKYAGWFDGIDGANEYALQVSAIDFPGNDSGNMRALIDAGLPYEVKYRYIMGTKEDSESTREKYDKALALAKSIHRDFSDDDAFEFMTKYLELKRVAGSDETDRRGLTIEAWMLNHASEYGLTRNDVSRLNSIF